MALPDKLGSYKWEHDGQSITLKSSLQNIKSLELDTGKNLYEFLDNCHYSQQYAKLFYHMQDVADPAQRETEDAIYAFFFGDLIEFKEPETQEKLNDLTYVLLGADKAKVLAAQDTGKKKPKAPKESA